MGLRKCGHSVEWAPTWYVHARSCKETLDKKQPGFETSDTSKCQAGAGAANRRQKVCNSLSLEPAADWQCASQAKCIASEVAVTQVLARSSHPFTVSINPASLQTFQDV